VCTLLMDDTVGRVFALAEHTASRVVALMDTTYSPVVRGKVPLASGVVPGCPVAFNDSDIPFSRDHVPCLTCRVSHAVHLNHTCSSLMSVGQLRTQIVALHSLHWLYVSFPQAALALSLAAGRACLPVMKTCTRCDRNDSIV
jgi:hypothetical protein